MADSRIFVIDDDPVNLKVIRAFLHKEPYDLATANTGQGALDMLEDNPAADLILLDVVLPDIDGITVCRKLKQNPKTVDIPVILMSGLRKDDSSIRSGLDAGAEGYLTKPIEEIPLRAWIKATMRINELQRELHNRKNGTEGSHQEVLEAFAKLSHAVNNPLQALYASVDMLTLALPDSEEVAALSADIFAYAEKVAKLVAQASIRAKSLIRVNPPGPSGNNSK